MFIKFKGHTLILQQGLYDTKSPHDTERRTALSAFTLTRELFTVISVNLVDTKLAPGHMAIKDYSENEGIMEALIEYGVISKPMYFVESGHVQIPIVQYFGIETEDKPQAPSPAPSQKQKSISNYTTREMMEAMSIAGEPEKITGLMTEILTLIQSKVDMKSAPQIENMNFALRRVIAEMNLHLTWLEKATGQRYVKTYSSEKKN